MFYNMCNTQSIYVKVSKYFLRFIYILYRLMGLEFFHSSFQLLFALAVRRSQTGERMLARQAHDRIRASPRLMLVICMRNWNRRWFLRDYFRRCSSPLCRGVATINYAKRADISGNPGWSFEIPRGLGIRVDLFQEMRDERRLRRTWNRLKIREKWTRYGEIFNGWWLVLGKFERFRQWWTVEIWRGFYCYN